MTKREELDFFSCRAQELLDSKYILADIKIVNLLKAIASSSTILALFKNCLTDFDYYAAKKKYLVKSPLSDERGEFVSPASSRELLALTFNLLVDMDSKNIVLSDFLEKFFYEDGSCYAGYAAFKNAVISPFKNSVETLMESVIEGKLQDPVEALTEEEEKRAREKAMEENAAKQNKEEDFKAYTVGVKKMCALLLEDKKRIKLKRIDADKKREIILIIDMLANAIESTDKDAITYAYVAYKYVIIARPLLFIGRLRTVDKAMKGILNGL